MPDDWRRNVPEPVTSDQEDGILLARELTPEEHRQKWSDAFQAISAKSWEPRRSGKYILINPRGTVKTEQEVRRIYAGVQVPIGYSSWSEFVCHILKETSMSQRALSRALKVSPLTARTWVERISLPTNEMRLHIITFAIDRKIIDREQVTNELCG